MVFQVLWNTLYLVGLEMCCTSKDILTKTSFSHYMRVISHYMIVTDYNSNTEVLSHDAVPVQINICDKIFILPDKMCDWCHIIKW